MRAFSFGRLAIIKSFCVAGNTRLMECIRVALRFIRMKWWILCYKIRAKISCECVDSQDMRFARRNLGVDSHKIKGNKDENN